MYRYLLTPALLLAATGAYAQPYTVKGVISGDKQKPVPSANINLLKASDSSWVASEISGDDGSFQLKAAAGSYLLDARALGYAPAQQLLALNKDVELTITLTPAQNALQEVTITNSRPYIENAPGKTIVNVESSVTSKGSNAYELLKRSPGVQVDINGNISMLGKQGVLVLINDKLSYLAGQELVEYLKSLPAEDIKQLELITQPSARYDASGNAGIINIKQKKNKKEGFNGSINTAYHQGVYGYTPHSMSLNYRKNKLNVYAHGNYFYSTSYRRGKAENSTFDAAGNKLIDNSNESFLRESLSDVAVRTGVDYDISERTSISISGEGNYHPNNELDHTNTTLTNYIDNSIIYNTAIVNRGFYRNRYSANGYFSHDINDVHHLTANADYLYNYRRQWNYLSSGNAGANGAALAGGLDLRDVTPGTIEAFSANVDYNGKLAGLAVEAGAKSSMVAMDNNAMFDIYSNNQWQHDQTRSNHFRYHEQLNALYVNASKDFNDKWKAQAGLRAEQATIEGHQLVNNLRFARHFLSLFPTAFAMHKISDKHQIEANYGRRIERPGYNMLNPFPNFFSQYFYTSGNPGLLPQFNNNIELKHSYNGSLLTTKLHYSTSRDIVTSVNSQIPGTPILTERPENTAGSQTAGISLTAYKQLLSWFETTLAAYGYYSEYSGTLNGQETFVAGTGGGFNIDTQFKFRDGWSAEAHAYCAVPSRNSIVSYDGWIVYPMAGISKKFLKDTLTVAFTVADPLHTYRYRSQANSNTVRNSSVSEFNTNQYGINISYAFGKQAEQKQRKKGMEEESRRM